MLLPPQSWSAMGLRFSGLLGGFPGFGNQVIHACVQSSGRVPYEVLRWNISVRYGAKRCERYFHADVGASCRGTLFVGLSWLRVCWTSLTSNLTGSWQGETVISGAFERKRSWQNSVSFCISCAVVRMLLLLSRS